MAEPRVLTLDIENGPNLAYVWGLWDQNIAPVQLADDSTILCFAAKWLNEKKTIFSSIAQDKPENMIKHAWDLLDEADVVVGWNQKGHDIKHLNREFLEYGYGPPSYYANLDLLTLVRSKFKFPSNKLEYVANKLGVGQKMKNSGFELWLRCMAGTLTPNTEVDIDAWKEMEKYNRQDVKVTEGAYLKVRGWDTSSFNMATFVGEDVCRVCAGRHLERRGFKAKGASIYQQYRCMDCQAWSTSKSPVKNDDDGNELYRPTLKAI